MGTLTFKKEERLNKEKWIRELFEKGSSFHLHPFRVIFLRHPDPAHSSHQVMISVSTRNFKKAVDRNRIKRRIREGYRLNKSGIISTERLLIAYIYTAKEILSSQVIHQKMTLAFGRLQLKEHDQKN